LYSARFITEVETELKIRAFVPWSGVDARFVGIEKIVEAVGNGVVKESRHAKESFGDKINPFDEHFELQILPEMHGCKVNYIPAKAGSFVVGYKPT